MLKEELQPKDYSNKQWYALLNKAGFLDMKDYGRYGGAAKPGYYQYIAFTQYQFLAEKIAKYARKDDTFVDIGCGIGDKLYLANKVFKDWKTITGIEINPETYYVAKYLLTKAKMMYNNPWCDSKTKLILEDALDVDYSNYSFIYMFHPISDRRIYSELIKRIKETTKDNTILFEMLHHNYSETRIVDHPRSYRLMSIKVNGEFQLLEEY